MEPVVDPEDNGYSSRKLHLTYFTMFAIFGAAVLSANWLAFAPMFPTLVGGLLAAAGIYTGGNLGAKWVISKHIQGMAAQDEEPAIAPKQDIDAG